jgi:hypothetical protein
MSSTPPIAAATQPDPPEAPASSGATLRPRAVADLLLCLPALVPDALPAALQAIATAFPSESVLVASANLPENPADFPTLELIPYTAARSDVGWILAAGDYAAAARLALEHNVRTILLLGGDTAALSAPNALNAPMLRSLADCMRSKNIDLVLPRFALGPNEALVNSALLYPLSRALFGADIRFPLPIDAALSARMAQRLSITTQRLIALNQGHALLWPVAEAASAGYSVREVPAGDATPPTPPPPQNSTDFNALFTSIAGSLFTDIEAKASFWQRVRCLPLRPNVQPDPPSFSPLDASSEIHSMIETFHLAQDNLEEIWSLVLPPQSRLALKRLSQLSPDAFTLQPDLWARIVYDFTLAFHLRTLNRSHLLGAMTPLYLAWVASYLRTVADDPTRAATAIELTASAFENEKSYIVSRWRWPDRFNP